jgi:hypothetical protein
MPVRKWVVARLLLGVATSTPLTWLKSLAKALVPPLSLPVPRLGVVPLKRLLDQLLRLSTVQKVVLLPVLSKTPVEFLAQMRVLQLLLKLHVLNVAVSLQPHRCLPLFVGPLRMPLPKIVVGPLVLQNRVPEKEFLVVLLYRLLETSFVAKVRQTLR